MGFRPSMCQLLFNYINVFFIILQLQHKVTVNTQGPSQTLTKLTWQCVGPLVWDDTCGVGLIIVDYSSRKQRFDHNLLARNRLRDKCQRAKLKACFYVGLRHHLLRILITDVASLDMKLCYIARHICAIFNGATDPLNYATPTRRIWSF